MRHHLFATTALVLGLAPAPAFASAVNNYNPTEGFLANGINPNQRLVDLHLTAQTATAANPGTTLAPSLGFAAGLGHGWELGLASQLNMAGLGTTNSTTTLDQLSAYLHGGLVRFNDNVALGVVGGANFPWHAGANLQLGAEGVLELDFGNMALAFNSGYLRDVTAVQGQLYENVNATVSLGSFTPYLEYGLNLYPDGRPTDSVVRGDLGYAVTDHLTADANLALFFPSLAWGPSVGFTLFF